MRMLAAVVTTVGTLFVKYCAAASRRLRRPALAMYLRYSISSWRGFLRSRGSVWRRGEFRATWGQRWGVGRDRSEGFEYMDFVYLGEGGWSTWERG